MKIRLILKRHLFLLLCLCLHICFFFSAAYFGWFNIFFSAPALHLQSPLLQGVDFYQVPRGAWAFWHGGSLTGALLNKQVYAPGQSVNKNVYHPVFTLVLGSLLMLLSPHTAYYAWLWAKLPLSLAGVAYFYWSFRDRPYVQFASCILLVNMSIYAELASGQYQILLNILLLLFLTTLIKHASPVLSAVFYFLTLLVKPVGLLFLPALLIKQRWKMACITFGVFILLTWIFVYDPYYSNNILTNLTASPLYIDIQIITLSALLHSFRWSGFMDSLIQYGFLVVILGLTSFRRIPLSKAVFLMIVYFLCFYTLVYEYDWSMLAYVIAPCLICCPSFQTRLSRICIILICLPSCYVILNLLHIDVTHNTPGTLAWQLMVISKLLPLFLLTGSVFWHDCVIIRKQAMIFFEVVKKMNDHLNVFG